MTEEGPRVTLEDNDDGKGQEAPAEEGEEQAGNANAQSEQKSG